MFFGQWNRGESEAGTRVGQGLREVPACSCLRLVSYKLLVAPQWPVVGLVLTLMKC